MRVLLSVIVALLVVTDLSAQDATVVDPLTKELLTEMVRRDEALAMVAQARIDAMLATQEGRRTKPR